MASPTVKLNSGYDMPLCGFGLWKVSNDTCADTVYNAIKAGYRLLDGACGTSNRFPNNTCAARKLVSRGAWGGYAALHATPPKRTLHLS
jgi:D-xylose reductase